MTIIQFGIEKIEYEITKGDELPSAVLIRLIMLCILIDR
jgi:hypothetical protein